MFAGCGEIPDRAARLDAALVARWRHLQRDSKVGGECPVRCDAWIIAIAEAIVASLQARRRAGRDGG